MNLLPAHPTLFNPSLVSVIILHLVLKCEAIFFLHSTSTYQLTITHSLLNNNYTTMASYTRDSRSAVRAQRRDSSSSSSSHTMSNRQRPRLLRSSATEPSITVSNATGTSFAGPESPHRATDLLSRVAVYSPSPEPASTPAAIPRHSGPMSICRDHREHSPSSSPGSQSVAMSDSPSGMICRFITNSPQTDNIKGYYFSFPSFEEWNTEHQDDMAKDSDD